MMKTLILSLAVLLAASVFGAERVAQDTSGYTTAVGYVVGNTIGGRAIGSVTTWTQANLQAHVTVPGVLPTAPTYNQWKVYQITSDISITSGAGAVINWTRATDGITSPQYVIIDLNGHTIQVDIDTGQGLLNSTSIMSFEQVGTTGSLFGAHHCIIKNGWLIHNLNDGAHGRCRAISISGQNWIDFNNLRIDINRAHHLNGNRYSVGGVGVGMVNSAGGPGAYELLFDNVDVWNWSTAFYRRDETFASGFSIQSINTFRGVDSMQALFGFQPQWQNTMRNCDVGVTPHFGFYLSGKINVYNCTSHGREMNDYYEWRPGTTSRTITATDPNVSPFPDASFPADGQWPDIPLGVKHGTVGSGAGWSQFYASSNSYQFALSNGLEQRFGLQPGSRVHDCLSEPYVDSLFPDSIYYWKGCRGWDIEHVGGNVDSSVEIYDNIIRVREGPNGDFSQGSAWGMRLRWGGGNIKIHDNLIEGFASSLWQTGNDYTAPQGAGLYIFGIRMTGVSSNGSGFAENYWIYNNRVNFYQYDDPVFGSGTGDVRSIGFSGDYGLTADGGTIPLNTNRIYGNHFNNCHYQGIHAGGGQPFADGTIDGATFWADTIVRAADYNDLDGWSSIAGGYGGARDTANTFLDMVYQSGATESQRSALLESGNDWWAFQRTIRVLVMGNNGLGINGASVKGWNNYPSGIGRDTVMIKTSGTMGVAVDSLNYERQGAGIFSDSTLFNPFGFIARSGVTNSTVASFAVGPDSARVILLLALPGTEDTTGWRGAGGGSGPPTDDPPVLAAIGNKSVVETFNLNFSVTATDDNSTPSITTTTLPGGATFVTASSTSTSITKTFSWTPADGQLGSYPITFTAHDAIDQQDFETITVTVSDNGPGGGGGTGNAVKVRVGSLLPEIMNQFGFRFDGASWRSQEDEYNDWGNLCGYTNYIVNDWTQTYDVDKSGQVDIGDVVDLVAWIFSHTESEKETFTITAIQ